MSTAFTTVALGLAMQVGQPAPQETPNYPPLQNAYNQYGFEGQYEQRHPFDTQQNWVHGYFQEIPAYGGHTFYRPYNYKDVMSQSQTAAGWGASPTLPYSQQFWHKYHDQATMLKLSQQASPLPEGQVITHMPAGMMQPQPHLMAHPQPQPQMYQPAPQFYQQPQMNQVPYPQQPMVQQPNGAWSNIPAPTANPNIVIPTGGLILPQQQTIVPGPAYAPAPQQMLYPVGPATTQPAGPTLPAFP